MAADVQHQALEQRSNGHLLRGKHIPIRDRLEPRPSTQAIAGNRISSNGLVCVLLELRGYAELCYSFGALESAMALSSSFGASSSCRSKMLLWEAGTRQPSLASASGPCGPRACYLFKARSRRALFSTWNEGRESRVHHRPALPVLSARQCSVTTTPLQANRASKTRSYSSAPTNPQIISTTSSPSPGHTTATLTVSNPTKLNIVNSALLSELTQKCHTLTQDPTLRAVVLTGAPTAPGKSASFIGGADINEMIALSSAASARAFIDRIHAACDALRAIPVPVIAKIDGFCLGAGMEIAAACDLRVATKGSVFGMPEVKVGIPSVVEAAYLPGLIGMGRTRRVLYLAENFGAEVMERWGFLESVVEGERELEGVVEGWVEALVGMGPRAIRSQKVLMQRWENCTVVEGVEEGAKAYAEAFEDGGKEPKEFMGRFVGRKR